MKSILGVLVVSTLLQPGKSRLVVTVGFLTRVVLTLHDEGEVVSLRSEFRHERAPKDARKRLAEMLNEDSRELMQQRDNEIRVADKARYDEIVAASKTGKPASMKQSDWIATQSVGPKVKYINEKMRITAKYRNMQLRLYNEVYEMKDIYWSRKVL
jgi:hypothetical protein